MLNEYNRIDRKVLDDIINFSDTMKFLARVAATLMGHNVFYYRNCTDEEDDDPDEWNSEAIDQLQRVVDATFCKVKHTSGCADTFNLFILRRTQKDCEGRTT